jgi:hypothetical protein
LYPNFASMLQRATIMVDLLMYYRHCYDQRFL